MKHKSTICEQKPHVVPVVLFFLCCTALMSGQTWSAAPVVDGTVSPNSLQQVIEQQKALNERLSRMELRIQALLEVIGRVDQVQKEVQRISGEVEIQTHDVTTMKKRQRDLYLDVDRRLGKVEKSMSAMGQNSTSSESSKPVLLGSQSASSTRSTSVPVVAPTPKSNNTGQSLDSAASGAPAETPPVSLAGTKTEIDAYQRAFTLLKEGRYDLAIASFQAYLDTFPSAKYSDNAQYWLGEANYVQRRYKKSIEEFKKVVEKYPTSPKVADAMLKLGFAYNEVGDKKEAISVLETISAKFPGTTAARLASKRLATIKSGK